MNPTDFTDCSETELWSRLGDAEAVERGLLLLELAERAAAQNEPQRAATLFAEAAATAREASDMRMASHALRRQGNSLFASHSYSESASAYLDGAVLARQSGWSLDEAWLLWGAADARLAMDDFVGALEAANSARSLAEAEGHSLLAAHCCYVLERALYWLDREEEALAAWADARAYYRTEGATDEVGRVDDFALTILLYLGKLDDALEVATSCYVLAKNAPTGTNLGYAMRLLAEVHLRRNEYDQAVELSKSAADIHRQDNFLLGVARAERLRGRALRDRGSLREALEVLTEARTLFDATGDDSDVLGCDEEIAWLKSCTGDISGAMRLNRRIALELEDQPEAEGLRRAVIRLAANHVEQEDWTAALAILDKWLQAWPDDEQDWAIRRALELKAEVLDETDDLWGAALIARRALVQTSSGNVGPGTARAYEIVARWMLENHEEGASSEMAHAIALHLAVGSSERAAKLSEFFMPDLNAYR